MYTTVILRRIPFYTMGLAHLLWPQRAHRRVSNVLTSKAQWTAAARDGFAEYWIRRDGATLFTKIGTLPTAALLKPTKRTRMVIATDLT
jgi:hypothetical protein